MKKTIGLLLCLVLITLGAYLGCGLLARYNYDKALSELQENFPGQLESSYKQGLFSSELEIILAFPLPDASAITPETISGRIKQTIQHGPLVFGGPQKISLPIPAQLRAHGSFELEPFMANEPQAISQLRQLATTDITVHAPLKGRPEIIFTGSPRQAELTMGNESFTLNWQGFRGNLFLEGNNLLSYDLDFLAPGLEIRGAGPQGISIEEITTRARMHEGSHKLSLGTLLTTVKKIEILLGKGPEERVAMNDLKLRITNSEHDALLRVEEEISLAHLQFADKIYGPGNLKISLANLDTETVAKLTEAIKSLQGNPGNTDVMAMGLLSSHASTLLAKSPEIRIENFSMASPDGACISSAHIAFNGEGEVILNPFFLLGRLSAEADFSADERFMAVQVKNFIKERLCAENPDPACDQEAARASSQQLQDLVAQNILLLAGGKYTMTASFKDGQAILNRQPVPLSF